MICIYKKSLQSTFDINFSLIHVCLVPIFGRQNLVPDFGSGFRALVPGFIPSLSIGSVGRGVGLLPTFDFYFRFRMNAPIMAQYHGWSI